MMIHDLHQLAEHVGAAHPTRTSIARRLYKDTECGIAFWCDAEVDGENAHSDSPTYVIVAGYAEGSNAECPPHRMLFPFTSEEFDAAVKEADEEGCELWYEANNANEE